MVLQVGNIAVRHLLWPADDKLLPQRAMTPPLGLTDTQIVDERPGRPNLFLDGSLEFFRTLA